MSAIGYFHDLTYICSPAPLQFGAAAGLRQLADSDFYTELARAYEAKRDQLREALDAAGLHSYVPQGAYYVLADATRISGVNASDRARTLLRATGVAAVPGSAFFRPGFGDHLLRFCFGKRPADLDGACESLRKL